MRPTLAESQRLDRVFAELRDRIFIREEDYALILPPNQVYSLNPAAFRVLDFLQRGGTVGTILAAQPGEKTVCSDIEDLLLGIKRLLSGELDSTTPGVDFLEFKKEFYTYPVLAEFAVTYRCNLRCRFCYLKGEPGGELTTRRARKILDKITDEARVPFVSFTGGEPLLRRDIAALIRHARRIGLKVNLISNGILLSREKVAELKEAGLGSAQISLEAPLKELHNRLTGIDSFERTVRGIQNLLAAGIYVHTNTTVNRENYLHLKHYPAFLKTIGVKKFSANLIIPVGRAGENPGLWLSYREIGPVLQEMRDAAGAAGVEFVWYSPLPLCVYNPLSKGLAVSSCAACHGLVSVNPVGDILPCSSYPRPLGNWLKKDFKSLWFSEEALYFRRMHYLPEVCRGCEKREICAGACPLYWQTRGCHEIAS